MLSTLPLGSHHPTTTSHAPCDDHHVLHWDQKTTFQASQPQSTTLRWQDPTPPRTALAALPDGASAPARHLNWLAKFYQGCGRHYRAGVCRDPALGVFFLGMLASRAQGDTNSDRTAHVRTQRVFILAHVKMLSFVARLAVSVRK